MKIWIVAIAATVLLVGCEGPVKRWKERPTHEEVSRGTPRAIPEIAVRSR